MIINKKMLERVVLQRTKYLFSYHNTNRVGSDSLLTQHLKGRNKNDKI